MNIRLILHVLDADLLLFDGPVSQCPPIPRIGEEIVHDQRRVLLEGVRYSYRDDHWEISLLA